jgi:hypothetical protein
MAGLDGYKNLALTGILSSQLTARSQSLYRLRWPGPRFRDSVCKNTYERNKKSIVYPLDCNTLRTSFWIWTTIVLEGLQRTVFDWTVMFFLMFSTSWNVFTLRLVCTLRNLKMLADEVTSKVGGWSSHAALHQEALHWHTSLSRASLVQCNQQLFSRNCGLIHVYTESTDNYFLSPSSEIFVLI